MEQSELRPPKRGILWQCLSCQRVMPHYCQGLCVTCYRKERNRPTATQRKRKAAYERRRRAEAKLPYDVGGWDDPAVQAHHKAMLQQYFPDLLHDSL